MSSQDRATPTIDLSELNATPETPTQPIPTQESGDLTEGGAQNSPPVVSISTWILIAITAINLAVSGVNYWHWMSLSYNDISDAPIFYYTDENALAQLAAGQKDPSQFIEKMIGDVQRNHGVVFDREAILIAAPEFKLIPDAELASAGK